MVENRVRVRVSFRVRVRFGFGIGNLIGGAVGTVGCALARRLCAVAGTLDTAKLLNCR